MLIPYGHFPNNLCENIPEFDENDNDTKKKPSLKTKIFSMPGTTCELTIFRFSKQSKVTLEACDLSDN